MNKLSKVVSAILLSLAIMPSHAKDVDPTLMYREMNAFNSQWYRSSQLLTSKRGTIAVAFRTNGKVPHKCILDTGTVTMAKWDGYESSLIDRMELYLDKGNRFYRPSGKCPSMKDVRWLIRDMQRKHPLDKRDVWYYVE